MTSCTSSHSRTAKRESSPGRHSAPTPTGSRPGRKARRMAHSSTPSSQSFLIRPPIRLCLDRPSFYVLLEVTIAPRTYDSARTRVRQFQRVVGAHLCCCARSSASCSRGRRSRSALLSVGVSHAFHDGIAVRLSTRARGRWARRRAPAHNVPVACLTSQSVPETPGHSRTAHRLAHL